MTQVRSVLVIDDDKDDFELVAEALAEIDPAIKVNHIANWEDCEKYEGWQFSLVLLDLNMPMHDGFYWLNAIREKGYTNLPVIIYTNSLFREHIIRSYESGATLYFVKPDDYPTLLKSLEALISLDWTDPSYITRQYYQPGVYKTFLPE